MGLSPLSRNATVDRRGGEPAMISSVFNTSASNFGNAAMQAAQIP